jgi:hypothetical protein
VDFNFIEYETDDVKIIRMICTELDRLRFLQQAANGSLPIRGDQVITKKHTHVDTTTITSVNDDGSITKDDMNG